MSAKYPRTFHFPWSPCCTNDDKRMKTARSFVGRPVVLAEKMDGGNCCLTKEAVFMRTHAAAPTHPSTDWLKGFHARARFAIPEGISVFCEYTYAVHNIEYQGLPSYLWLIRVRHDSKNLWMPWRDTEAYAKLLGIPTVPVVGISSFSSEEKLQKEVERQAKDGGLYGRREGIVVTPVQGFLGEDFETSVGKDVRIMPSMDAQHWSQSTVKKQKLVKLVEATV